MMLVKSDLSSHQLYANVNANNAFNICVASIGIGACLTVIIVVYRTPWAKVDNTKEFFSALDGIIIKHARVILVDDFSIPVATVFSSSLDILHRLSTEHSLSQLAVSPARGNSLINLVFLSRCTLWKVSSTIFRPSLHRIITPRSLLCCFCTMNTVGHLALELTTLC